MNLAARAVAVPGEGVLSCVRVCERVQEKNIIIYYNIYNNIIINKLSVVVSVVNVVKNALL